MLKQFLNRDVGFSGSSTRDAVIIIPVYRHFAQLEEEEKISLSSAFEHFLHYSFVFIGPEILEKQAYLDFAAANHITADFYPFEDKYFTGKDAYSRLLVSTFFYQKFSRFQYMLICQTDAFVFKNDLQKWMTKGYTYIGAPWVNRDIDGKVTITGSGNGGFSLRKIPDFISLANRIEYLQALNRFWKEHFIIKKIPFGLFLRVVGAPVWLKCKINKYTFYLSEDHLQNEDRYWCEWVSQVFQDFRNAPAWICSSFAIEEEPRFLIKELGGELPMGCHAWSINDPELWNQYINKK